MVYQGQFGFDKLYYLPDFDLSHVNVLEWDNCINSLAVAYKMCMGSHYVSQTILMKLIIQLMGLRNCLILSAINQRDIKRNRY
jgi:starch synthase